MARRRHRRRRTFPWPAVALALLLALAAGLYLGVRLGRAPAPEPGGEAPSRGEAPSAPAPPPAPVSPPPALPPAPDTAAGPAGRIAVVIDDLGRSLAAVDRLAGLGVPTTGTVLPFEPRSAAVARALAERGLEVLCHLPMEPATPGADPGAGALRRSMDAEEIREATRRALAAVPGAIGANNHMGSAFSADAEAMRPVLEVIADGDLLYLDSRTGAGSVAYRLARALGVPSAERDVFLDDASAGAALEERWRDLLAEARSQGAAIAIGHPHEATLAFLERAVPAAVEAGYEFVPVSYLVDRTGHPPL